MKKESSSWGRVNRKNLIDEVILFIILFIKGINYSNFSYIKKTVKMTIGSEHDKV